MRKTSNKVFTALFMVIAVGSSIAAMYGATHQAFIAALSLIMIILLINDTKKSRNENA